MVFTEQRVHDADTSLERLLKYVSGISTSDIEEYLSEVEKYPVLSEEEEQSLAERVYDNGDESALERLVLSNLRLVARIALDCCDHAPPADFISPVDKLFALYEWSTGAPAAAKALSYRRALPTVASS